jgi:catechol 2,3-dioxygenase-like lactoylglutathione lyase family enzyme
MGMDHVGFVVPDAQLAADFLIDVFDAEFDWEVKREPRPTAGERGWSQTFGVHPDSYMPHIIMLKCGDQPMTQYIEIFEWKSPDQPILTGEGAWHKFSDIGNSYISFTVKDMDVVVEHIKTKVIPKYQGVRFIQDPPMRFPLRGEICTSTFLVSPWGMWIELTSSHDILAEAKKLIESEGIRVDGVSGGGSCNYMDALNKGILTEVQAGGGAICDLLYYHKANLKDHGHLMGALLLTQIISMPSDQSRAIGNAGFKSIGLHLMAQTCWVLDFGNFCFIG